MCGFVFRRLVVAQSLPNMYRSSVQNLGTTHLDLCLSLLPSGTKSFSTVREQVRLKRQKDYSFTVSYLINSCSLSPERAESVSKRIKLQSAKKPDSVLEVLRNYGFTSAQISKVVRMRPDVLLAHPERSILPKFEFFNSIGVTAAEMASVCSSTPSILRQSLENLLIPNYNFLKSVLQSDENVIRSFRKKSWIFQHDLRKIVSPKLAFLREHGMPESFIVLILTCYNPVVLQRRDKFDENVKKVMEMGFHPKKCAFIHAMQVFASVGQSTWEHKLDVFRSWGWSDEDIKLVFRKCPNAMATSANKITSVMDFLVNKMGWQSSDAVIYPDVLRMNLEKRVIPRCLVIKVLQSKGFVKKNLSLSPFLRLTEKHFMDRFVTNYMDDVPELLNIYKRKEDLQALDMNNHVSSSNFESKCL